MTLNPIIFTLIVNFSICRSIPIMCFTALVNNDILPRSVSQYSNFQWIIQNKNKIERNREREEKREKYSPTIKIIYQYNAIKGNDNQKVVPLPSHVTSKTFPKLIIN